MEKINFIKMHGLGNDFVVIDKRLNDINISDDLIKKLSDRKSGAGCDQLITINQSNNKNIDAKIEIFNPNGDRAEACGNGTRCVAKILFEEFSKNEINIESDVGILNAKKINNHNISVNLGKLTTNWKKIPLNKNIDTLNIPIDIEGLSNGVAVNIGNPHIVLFGKNIKNIKLEKIGPLIEKNKLFPNRTNVEIVEVINKKKIEMRVWERGVGITLACGSGACAAVYAGQLKNLLENNVSIGKSCIIGSQIMIKNSIIGNNVVIQDGTKIGLKGFGFIPMKEKNFRFPHIGKVILDDNVEIGAACTIDRGSIDDTKIGANTFLDNQVHMAHNVKLGKNCMIAGQVGFAGSSTLGNNVSIGGQAGISGHLKIGNNVKIGGGSGVVKDISDNEVVMGYPAVSLKEFLKKG